ncbi:amidohydrolase [Catenulispora rubra]|uniref:amidohydrolase n=1 Tax=Catenulispora rubra TaxID=280293 RepID=UPI0018922FEA|nr:amidohydrolase [Catenulispora rubra]
MPRALELFDDALADELAEFYKDLHRDPELSFQENRTASRVVTAVEALGCEVTAGVGKTGVVAVLRNGKGPVIMLRADMDALPVREETGLPYASNAFGVDPAAGEVPVAHACGHDMHVTCLLGALTLLSRTRESWAGTVLAVFQPAEELAGGAAAMVADGLFERFPVPLVVLAQHVSPLPARVIGHRSGAFMAASDSVAVTLHGRGGHASAPELTIDPVLMAAAAVVRLQSIVAREVSMQDEAVVTVGRMQAGLKDNVIPDTAELGINIRTYDPRIRERVRAAVERVIRAEAAAAGAEKEPDFEWAHAAPVLVNDPEAMAVTIGALTANFGAERIMQLPPVPASEDAGVFGQALGVPTAYWMWGGGDPDEFARVLAEGRMPVANHHPGYAPVLEPALRAGVEAMTVVALAWLDEA